VPELHLYHMPAACSRVTHIALEMAGTPYQVTLVRPHKGGLRDPALLALNPAGQVPVLIIDGQPMVENPAILLTLARLFPAAGILPVGNPMSEARGLSRACFVSGGLHPIVTRIMFPERFCNESDAAAERTRDLAKTMMLGKLDLVEPVLAAQPWWLGDTFSIADVYLAWVTGRMRGLGLDFSRLAAVSAHIDKVHGQPAVKAVMAREAEYVAEFKAEGMAYSPMYERILLV
jgi:glutathione S-transferase